MVTAQLKQFQEQQKGNDFAASTPPRASSSSAAAATYQMGPSSSAPPPPPQPPKESFARRYKFLWPLLLTINLAVGGHFLSLIYIICCLYVYVCIYAFMCIYVCFLYGDTDMGVLNLGLKSFILLLFSGV